METCIYRVLIEEAPIAEAMVHSTVEGLDVVPATLNLAGAEIELVSVISREHRLRAALQPMRAAYDYVLVDCPPSLGLLTINALTAADSVLVPIQCEYYALEGVSQLMRTVDLVRRHLNPCLEIEGVVLTMYDSRTNLSQQVVDDVKANLGDYVFRSVIPRNVRLSEAPSYGLPISLYDDRSKGAEAYKGLAAEVMEREGVGMAAKPRGLGKGLNAIIGADIVSEVIDRPRAIEIPVGRLSPNPFQPRRSFSEEGLEQLAESIRHHGVLQPIVVRPSGDGYQLIAGERRWRAAQIAGLQRIPAVVRELDDPGMVRVALIENLQREDLNPIEEALAYRRLMDEFKMTQEELSSSIGRSRPAIANAVRLLNLPTEIQRAVEERRLSEGHARCLLAIPDQGDQLKVAAKIIGDGLNVRQTEELVKGITRNVSRETTRKRTSEEDPDAVRLTQRLGERLGTRVKLSGSVSKGRLEIEYYSAEDLDRILEIILGSA